MDEFDIDGKQLQENPNDYLKETFDLPVYDGDIEDIYQYLSGFYSKVIINIYNKDLIDNEIINAFIRASEDNSFVKVEINE